MIGIAKTIKLFINGEFPRTESGRSFPVYYHESDKVYAHLCLASRKDFRTAVEASEAGHKSWSSRSAFNRSQILYRMAEMAEGKRFEFVSLFKMTLGLSDQEANQEIDRAIDSFVYYAGFCDKYPQLASRVNPINGPFSNVTAPEPVGVSVLIPDTGFDFGKLIANICSTICSGNSVILILDELVACQAIIAPLAEVFATSDLPKGVVNILTCSLDEVLTHLGSHMSVRSIIIERKDDELLSRVKELSVQNLKRVVEPKSEAKSLEAILSKVEFKTVWQPMGF